MKVHLITFCDGVFNEKYVKAASALASAASDMKIFESIKIYTADDLFTDPDFLDHMYFCMTNRRGFGYWIWKSFIIWKSLLKIDENDLLFYCDSCTSLYMENKTRFIEYIDITLKNPRGNLFFEYIHPIGDWCKMDVIQERNAEDLLDKNEIVPGVLFTTASKHNIELFKKIYEICSTYHMINDSPSVLPNLPRFKEHRHDQSIFSIQVYKMSPESICKGLFHELILDDKKSYPISIQTNHY